MTRNPRNLGLILVAALTIGAVTAPAASAQPFGIFSEDPAATEITGSDHNGNLDWKFDTGEFECENETEEGSFEEGEAESTALSVTLSFTECAKGTVDANGCKFVYHEGDIENGQFEGSVDLSCPGTKKLEVTSANCIVTVPSQKGLKKITYTNKGAGVNREITVDFNVTGLSYTEDQKGATPCKGGAKNNGAITGSRTLTGEDKTSKNMIGIWVQ